jgi:hypothetical protein
MDSAPYGKISIFPIFCSQNYFCALPRAKFPNIKCVIGKALVLDNVVAASVGFYWV